MLKSTDIMGREIKQSLRGGKERTGEIVSAHGSHVAVRWEDGKSGVVALTDIGEDVTPREPIKWDRDAHGEFRMAGRGVKIRKYNGHISVPAISGRSLIAAPERSFAIGADVIRHHMDGGVSRGTITGKHHDGRYRVEFRDGMGELMLTGAQLASCEVTASAPVKPAAAAMAADVQAALARVLAAHGVRA